MSTLNEEDRANLAAYLDGELDESAAQALEAKLNRDPDARQEVEELRQAWTLLDYLPRAEPSANFTNRTMERLALGRAVTTAKMPAAARSPGWLSVAGWAAAVLVVMGVGAAGSYVAFRPEPPPNEDDVLVQQLPVLERLRLYEQVVDIDFLRGLDHPELFGDDPGS